MKKRVRVLIMGRVQGVFFRQNTVEEARKRGVTGWVRNNADGTVEAVLEGEEDKVNEMIEWCRRGPEHAEVEDIQVVEEEYRGEFKTFKSLV
ncbi:MAG: acylphosphatase [Candidatus Aenigmatarchaeota archaeon]